jgi:lysophospholipase L1-like esterase
MRNRCTFIISAALFCCLFLKAGETDKLRPDIKADRVLFLGNSITRHAPAPKIGWIDDWGMAASAQEKDFVHLVISGIAAMTGKDPETKITNIADFERNLATFDLEAKLKAELDFKPTLVIIAIGENVAALNTDDAKAQFKTSFAKLLATVKSAGQPALIVRGCFWTDKTKDEIMKQACAAAGGTFVDIGALGKVEANFARSERKFDHDGVAAHPGDKGMAAIANAILKALKADAK